MKHIEKKKSEIKIKKSTNGLSENNKKLNIRVTDIPEWGLGGQKKYLK